MIRQRRASTFSPATPLIRNAWAGRIAALLLLAVGLSALPAVTHAQRPGQAERLPPGAPPAAQACLGCHGAQGEGNPQTGVPRIAGQSQRYLLKQLASYGDGSRRDRVMGPIARGLPPEVRAEVAEYYASREARVAAGTGPDREPPERGRVLAQHGDNALGVQACANCHGPGGVGEPPNMPYLAGLDAEYIVSELRAWKEGGRTNDAGQQMFTVAAALPDADMEAVAQYYASQPPPKPAPSNLIETPEQTPLAPGGESAAEAAGAPRSDGGGEADGSGESGAREGVGVGQGGAIQGPVQGPGGTGESAGGEETPAPANSGGGNPAPAQGGGRQWPGTVGEQDAGEPQSSAPGDPERGRAIVAGGEYGCPACHAIPGIEWPRGIVGPPLVDFGRRAFIAGRLPNEPQTLAAFVFNAPAIVPGTAMPNVGLTFEQARDVAAFLGTLGAGNGP